jgi:predicted nucleotidyltransferase
MMPAGDELFGLPPAVIAMIRGVFARYPTVREVRVYGSRAKGTFRPGSDIDLSIMDEHVSGEQMMQIANDFDDLPTLYTIDLALFRQIDNPALAEHILRIGKVFYSAGRSG